MKAKHLLFYLALFIPTMVLGQNQSDEYVFHSELEQGVLKDYLAAEELPILKLQLISDAGIDHESVQQHESLLSEWVTDLKIKQTKAKHQEQFIAQMFYKVHRKLLKNYKPFSSFHTTLSNGDYDCLSGTTLYAVLLNRLGYDFDIVETNYHIYLRVKLSDAQIVLLESTDPINGFINNPQEIKARLAQYDEGNSKTQDFQEEYVYDVKLNSDLAFNNLPGLHYYNESVEAFNSSNILDAIALLQKAEIFYKSERIAEFGSVLAQALLSNNEITRDEKRAYLAKISVVKKSGDFASLN